MGLAAADERQNLGRGVEEVDVFPVAEESLPFFVVLPVGGGPEGEVVALGEGDLYREDALVRLRFSHRQTFYPVGRKYPLKAIPRFVVRSGEVLTGLPASMMVPSPAYIAT